MVVDGHGGGDCGVGVLLGLCQVATLSCNN